MKILLLIPILVISLSGCNKKCEVSSPTCLETVPTDEFCQAAFSRYFYNQDTGECELISYSGCSQRGFETLPECQECGCD